MHSTDSSTESPASVFCLIWLLTLAVAGLPVVFGLYQVWLFFDEAFPHLYWSRTFPALAGVALCLAGIAAPLWVIVKKREFCRWPRTRQWWALSVVFSLMLLAYLVPFASLCDAARKSRAILPYTPSVYLRYDTNDQPRFSFGVAGGTGTGHGSTRSNRDRVVVEWHAWLEPKELSRPRGADPVVHLRCEARPPDVDLLTLDVEIETGRTVRFDTRGFTRPEVKQAGKLVALPMELRAGTHRFAVQAKY